jgi:hypothetical protein
MTARASSRHSSALAAATCTVNGCSTRPASTSRPLPLRDTPVTRTPPPHPRRGPAGVPPALPVSRHRPRRGHHPGLPADLEPDTARQNHIDQLCGADLVAGRYRPPGGSPRSAEDHRDTRFYEAPHEVGHNRPLSGWLTRPDALALRIRRQGRPRTLRSRTRLAA